MPEPAAPAIQAKINSQRPFLTVDLPSPHGVATAGQGPGPHPAAAPPAFPHTTGVRATSTLASGIITTTTTTTTATTPVTPEGTPTPRPSLPRLPIHPSSHSSSAAAPAPALSISGRRSNLDPNNTTPRGPPPPPSPSSLTRGPAVPRQQSPLPNRQTALLRSLLASAQADALAAAARADQSLHVPAGMSTRKIWVRRGGASATLVTINEADLVDDVRELILRKYANSLGRQFDAPDLTLRITPREQMRQSRTLGPEEPMCRVLDAYFPGSQTVDEALVIEIPLRRSTPRASPRTGPPHAPQLTSVLYDDTQPPETGTDYFGPGAIAHLPIPLPAATVGATNAVTSPHSIAVLTNGQIPQIPSPGGSRSRPYRDRPERPRLGRQHTSSPTILGVVTGPQAAALAAAANVVNPPPPQAKVERSRTHSNASSDHSVAGAPANPPPAPPLPTPPAPETTAATIQRVATPPPRVSSPRPASSRPKKKKTVDHPPAPSSSIVTAVPPINVLIVEDNIINLRLLEQFVKRLKVRWQTAMNGQEAVTKWRAGGFHLVLMDIQLPVMNGLEATKEIRRLERVNSIGVMSSSQSKGAGNGSNDSNEPSEEDRLENRELFKSPVIIVALTASSLQSDRHHALAAGCNDFLTKPLIFAWFQRKVMEWGCMQALIDFDGWRKWKDFSQKADETDPTKKTAAKAKTKKNRLSTASAA